MNLYRTDQDSGEAQSINPLSYKIPHTVYNYTLRTFFLRYLEERERDVNGLSLLNFKKYVAVIRRRTTQHGVKITLKAFLRLLMRVYEEQPLGIERERLAEIYKYFKVDNIKDSLPELPPNLPEIVEKLIDYETRTRKGRY